MSSNGATTSTIRKRIIALEEGASKHNGWDKYYKAIQREAGPIGRVRGTITEGQDLTKAFTGHVHVRDLLAKAQLEEHSLEVALPDLLFSSAIKTPSFKEEFTSLPVKDIQETRFGPSAMIYGDEVYDDLYRHCQADLYLFICSYSIKRHWGSARSYN